MGLVPKGFVSQIHNSRCEAPEVPDYPTLSPGPQKVEQKSTCLWGVKGEGESQIRVRTILWSRRSTTVPEVFSFLSLGHGRWDCGFCTCHK